MPQDAPPPEADEIDVSGLFDGPFYATAYPDVAAAAGGPAAHFRDFGWRERRRPNPWFDTGWYLDGNPDVCASGLNPLLHFIRFGEVEGRRPSPGSIRRGTQRRSASRHARRRRPSRPVPPVEPPARQCEDVGGPWRSRAAARDPRGLTGRPVDRMKGFVPDWLPE